MAQVSKARSLANKPREVVSILDFGARGDGVTDDTAALQEAVKYCMDNAKALHVPGNLTGIRLEGQVTLDDGPVASGGSIVPSLTIIGDGMYNSIFLDYNTAGPCFSATKAFAQHTWSDVGIRQMVDKPTQSMIDFTGNQVISSYSRVLFDGNNKLSKRHVYMHEMFETTFDHCLWKHCTGLGLWYESNLGVNGGNLVFIQPNIQFCKSGLYFKGTALSNNIALIQPKFVTSQREADYQNLTALGTFTAASTSVNIGAGHSISAGDLPSCMFIGNGTTGTEPLLVTAYDSGTGVATLAYGLEKNYSGDASIECVFGGIGLMTSETVSGLNLLSPHFEGNSFVLSAAPNTVMRNVHTGHVSGSYFGGNSYVGYVFGKQNVNVEFENVNIVTDRVDNKWLALINSAGAGILGPVRGSGINYSSGGSYFVLEDHYDVFGASSGQIRVIGSPGYKFERDYQQTFAGRVLAAGTSNGLPDGWSSAKVSTGRYQITHNFGSSSYVVIPVSEGNFYARVNSISANTFEYFTLDPTTNVVSDSNSSFILSTINNFVP